MELTITEKQFDRIIGSSFFIKPNTPHSDTPVKSTPIIPPERFSTSFSFSTLINCGSIDTEVNIPAIVPIIVSKLIVLIVCI